MAPVLRLFRPKQAAIIGNRPYFVGSVVDQSSVFASFS